MAILAVAIWAPASAWASAGEREIWAGVRARAAHPAAAGIELGVLRNITDFWALGASLQDLRRFDELSRGLTTFAADVRFVVDALRWVPAVSVSAGVAISTEEIPLPVPFARAELSLGWRPARTWGLTGAASYTVVAADGLDAPNTALSLRFVWYTGKGVGLDL